MLAIVFLWFTVIIFTNIIDGQTPVLDEYFKNAVGLEYRLP
jgi:hypothetical protein